MAYDPNALEAAGQRIVTVMAEHLRHVEGRKTKVLNWALPAKLITEAQQFLREGDPKLLGTQSAVQDAIAARFAELTRESLARGQNLHHPHYVGHQVPAPVPLAGLFDMVGSVTNQVMAIYEMGPWATAIEHAVVEAVGTQLGFPAGQFSGLVTSGGSIANLTGLLTARNVVLGDAWSAGLAGRKPAPVLVSHADAHYSVTRSAGILGLGTNQIISAALDEQRRMDPNRLDATLADLRARGVPIVAVVSTACATPIGAFDQIDQITDVCQRHDVWLHVDAAHGGGACFSPRHRHLLNGIERADSVVCDAHKMMFVPALCALVFYRQKEHRTAAFHQEAPYLFDPTMPELAQIDSGVANLECTKRGAAFGLWGIWSTFGPQLFADMVDVVFDTARQFYELLRETDDFETLHEPQCNIVAFRHVPPKMRDIPPQEIDAFQLRLRRAVIESGEYYLVQSRVDGRSVLRTTMMNPLTGTDDLHGLIACLRKFGRLLTNTNSG